MSHNRLAALRTYVQSRGWRWSVGKSIAHGEQGIVSDGTHQVVINYYPKRARIVLGGPESSLKTAVNAWLNGTDSAPTPEQPPLPPSGGTRFDELKAFIAAQGWNWGPGATIPYGEQIMVTAAQSTALVNFWPKRGAMQVQGSPSPLKMALQSWVDNGTVSTTSDQEIFTVAHIGIDESGKGDWFGPLVVAAVYVDESTRGRLQRAGVRDSKALDLIAIQRTAGQIERIVQLEHRVVRVIAPEEYNQLYADYGNINLLLADTYAEVAATLGQQFAQMPTLPIVCDQFSQRSDRLDSAFAARDLPPPVQQHRAETASIAVAAASILASAAFTDALGHLGLLAGCDGPLPRGASDREALEAAAHQIIAHHRPAALAQYAKLNFKPVQALLRTFNIE